MPNPPMPEKPPFPLLVTAPIAFFDQDGLSPLIVGNNLQELDAAELERLAPDVLGIAAAGQVRIDEEFLNRFPRLEIVANFGVGYDRVDIDAAAARGLVVTNTPDVLTDEVADLAVALMLATVRQLPQANRYLLSGKWTQKPFRLTGSLRGRKVGILGLGRIGYAVARRCAAFDVPVHYHNRRERTDAPFIYHDTAEKLCEAVDTLIVVTPGGRETEKLVGAKELSALGEDGIVVNVARGAVIDEAALIDALENGRLHGAGLDVYWNHPNVPARLLALENVVALPYVGSATQRTRRAMAELVARNLISWFEGNGPVTPVPETCDASRWRAARGSETGNF